MRRPTTLTLCPHPPACTPPLSGVGTTAPKHLKSRVGTDGEGRKRGEKQSLCSPRLCPPVHHRRQALSRRTADSSGTSMSVCTQTNNRDMGGRGYFPPGLHTGRRTCLSPRGGPARRHLFTLSAWGDVRCLPVKRSGASGRGEGTARVGGAIGRRERATREGGACGWRKRAAREGGASGRRGSGVAMLCLRHVCRHQNGAVPV